MDSLFNLLHTLLLSFVFSTIYHILFHKFTLAIVWGYELGYSEN